MNQIELLTEILDLLAGISVAPELIGKEKLESIRLKFISFGTPVKSKDYFTILTDMYGRNEPYVFKPVWYIGIVFSIAMMFLPPTTFLIQFFGFTPTLLLRLLIALPLFVLYYWFWLLILTIITFCAEIIIDIILSIALWISNKTTLSKSLLVFGFVLFVTSKLMKISFILSK